MPVREANSSELICRRRYFWASGDWRQRGKEKGDGKGGVSAWRRGKREGRWRRDGGSSPAVVKFTGGGWFLVEFSSSGVDLGFSNLILVFFGRLLDLQLLYPILQAGSWTYNFFTLFFRRAPVLETSSPCSSGGLLDLKLLSPVLQAGSWTYNFFTLFFRRAPGLATLHSVLQAGSWTFISNFSNMFLNSK
ncbi:hypothetical protein FXO37_34240 [Capsicum annuum]|nr:hypothetical protein FXO37_34240 [Capsicum annuum]